MTTDYYILFIYENVEPELIGPYVSANERDEEAKEKRYQEGEEHGVFKLSVDLDFDVEVSTYPGGFFDESDAR